MAEYNVNIIELPLEDIMHNSMMPYSEYTITDRALPRVEDGLKPVQRRILYSMLDLGITCDKPHKKSARIVGECLGKYHPHGDRSVYDAMVRMAQEFTMRNPLVDGHGNFGSIDNDPAAAMRYTEARLTKLALELTRDLEKDTVDWTLNFDDTMKEPVILPGRYPNLFVNGTQGIAVGLATNIPPHNLSEMIDATIKFIDNPKVKLEELLQCVKGPDFPTGAYILESEEIERMYATGKGKVVVRAKTSIEKSGDKYNIIITEIPYQVCKLNLVTSIEKLMDDKKELFSSINEIVDESDRKGMRVSIKLKRDSNPNQILNLLYKYSNLQINFNANILAIADGKPRTLDLITYLRYYSESQRKVVYRRTRYELDIAKERAHILEGLIIAISDIDNVIKIIKTADNITDAKQKLRDKYGLSEKQVQAILDMKLYRLNKLEVTKLQAELKELQDLIASLELIVADKKKQFSIVKSELLAIKKEYKITRKTQIWGGDSEASSEIVDLDETPFRSGKAVLCSDGNLKFMPPKSFNTADKSFAKNRYSDMVVKAVDCDTNNPLIAFTDKGNAVMINPEILADDKWKSRGLTLSAMFKNVDMEEKIICIFTKKEIDNKEFIFFTEQGMVKKTSADEYLIEKRPYSAIKLVENDKLVNVALNDPNSTLIFVTKQGNCLNCPIDLSAIGRVTSGVKGIKLDDDDIVVYANTNNEEGELAIITEKGFAKRVILASLSVFSRNTKGIKIQPLTEKSGNYIIYSEIVKMPFDIVFGKEKENDVFGVNTEELNIESMHTKGRKIPEFNEGFDKVSSHRVD